VDLPQEQDDENLTELFHTAVANHPGAGKKELREITRRVTQSYAEIVSLDQQIEEIADTLKVPPGSTETLRPLRQTLKDLENERLDELGNLGAAVGMAPRRPAAQQPTANLNAWMTLLIMKQCVIALNCLKDPPEYRITEHQVRWMLLSKKQTPQYLQRRWKDGKSLPMHLHVYCMPETSRAAQDLRQQIVALAREANVALDGAVDLDLAPWMGLGIARLCVHEGRSWLLPSQRGPRPEGGPKLLDNGQVDLYDLEQDILSQVMIPEMAAQALARYDEVSRAWPNRPAPGSKRE
jgi:hypothetical protein